MAIQTKRKISRSEAITGIIACIIGLSALYFYYGFNSFTEKVYAVLMVAGLLVGIVKTISPDR
ncbi:hypothetical protein ACJ3XI_06280 [Litorimonas sp. RW-G-Af-16]|uniref:hypothetical protein n=1 Tax=Litorimonas sp. RW-G-Af-16 TaxID=3241168 RepID=UPI00390C86F9